MRPVTTFLTTAVLALAACSSPGAGPATTPRPATAAHASPATVEPAQELVVGTKHFFAQCAGSGRSVMLVSGYADPMDHAWGDVQGRLGASYRTCAYDRLGVGRSDSPPPVQSFEEMAADLDGVIAGLHLERPLVVVGHSLGGPVSLMWASRHPTDVRTLVLIDPITPSYNTWLHAHLPPADPGDLERAGFLAQVKEIDDPNTNRESLDPTSYAAVERLGVIDAAIHVLSAGSMLPLPGVDAKQDRAAWLAGHRWLVSRSTAGKLTVVDLASHYIQHDRPDVVVQIVSEAASSR